MQHSKRISQHHRIGVDVKVVISFQSGHSSSKYSIVCTLVLFHPSRVDIMIFRAVCRSFFPLKFLTEEYCFQHHEELRTLVLLSFSCLSFLRTMESSQAASVCIQTSCSVFQTEGVSIKIYLQILRAICRPCHPKVGLFERMGLLANS